MEIPLHVVYCLIVPGVISELDVAAQMITCLSEAGYSICFVYVCNSLTEEEEVRRCVGQLLLLFVNHVAAVKVL